MSRKDSSKKIGQEGNITEVLTKPTTDEFPDNIVEKPRMDERLEPRDFGTLRLKELKPRKPREPKFGPAGLLPLRKPIVSKPEVIVSKPVRAVKEKPRMGVERLILKGSKGVAEGETFYINYGESVTIGRGHECDISYRNFKKYLQDGLKDKNLLAVSRKHVRISFNNTYSVELEDLSSNGTYLNGKPINKQIFITKITASKTPYEIRLGPAETFLLTAEQN